MTSEPAPPPADGCCYRGMRLLTEREALRVAGPLTPPLDATPEQIERLEAEHAQRLAAARNTAYPCPDHNPKAFARWCAGAYQPTAGPHHPSRSRARSEPPSAPPDPPRERKDLA